MILVDPDARAEIASAAEWIEDERSADGARLFLKSIEAACEYLEQYPELGELYRGDIRRKRLLPFQYDIYYVPLPKGIYVLAVAHEARKPGYFLRRLR